MTYPHPAPKPPPQLYLLGVLAGFGLIALWLAAFHAFQQVAGAGQSIFAATLIEAGLVIEALLVIRRPRIWYFWVGPLISVAVSATYNYIQASAQAPTMAPWPLLTLAVGPLSALLFVAVTLGHVLNEHQTAAAQWQQAQADWLEQKAAEREAYQRRQEEQRQARLQQLQDAERQRQAEQTAYQRQVEQEEREYRRKQAELARRREERQARTSGRTSANVQRTQPPIVERSPEADREIERLANAANGSQFGRTDAEQWLDIGKTKAAAIVKYGLATEQIDHIGGYKYIIRNGETQ